MAMSEALPPQLVGFEVCGELGAGSFGRVLKVQSRSGEFFAVKLLHRGDFNPLEVEAQESAAALCKDHVVSIIDYGSCGQDSYILLELMAGSLLEGHHDAEAAQVVQSLLLALQATHRQGFLHRDSKAANVLWKEVDGCRVYKISDYGAACRISSRGCAESFEVVGSSSHWSPEVLEGSPHSTMSDLWAIGVIGYELVTGREILQVPPREKQPQADFDSLRRQLALQLRSKPPSYTGMSQVAGDFYQRLLHFEPTSRATVEEALKHPYLCHTAALPSVKLHVAQASGAGGGLKAAEVTRSSPVLLGARPAAPAAWAKACPVGPRLPPLQRATMLVAGFGEDHWMWERRPGEPLQHPAATTLLPSNASGEGESEESSSEASMVGDGGLCECSHCHVL